jgi:hypothetical protein
LTKLILPNQRGFFNPFHNKTSANSGIRGILYSLKSSNPGKEELFKGVNDGKMDNWDKGKIEAFIKENNLNKSEDTDEWFLDLDYFLKQRKLRREDKWQS